MVELFNGARIHLTLLFMPYRLILLTELFNAPIGANSFFLGMQYISARCISNF